MPERRQRGRRSVTANLAAIVLATELVVVLLAALVLFGLHSLPPAIALGGGGGLLLLIVAAAALSTARVGIVLGWLVQAVLVATVVLDPAVGVVGILFAGLWTYSMIVGRRIDRRVPPST